MLFLSSTSHPVLLDRDKLFSYLIMHIILIVNFLNLMPYCATILEMPVYATILIINK